MMSICQSDVKHDCRSRMWHCSNCREDWCMGDQPKFCPLCGAKGRRGKIKIRA